MTFDTSIRFLADMNVSPKTVQGLRQNGWDISRVSQFLPAHASDQEVLDFARQEDRVIVTQDLDFSSLLALGGHYSPSLVTLRLMSTAPEDVTQRLLEVISHIERSLMEGSAVTIGDVAVRVHQLPIQ